VAIRRQPALLDDLREAGALVQVVAPSLAGSWGDEVWACAWDLVESGRADLLASDAHRVSGSSPQLAAVADLVEVRYGAEAKHELTERTPARLLEAAATEA
jgi:protein-tyrosine phosphatase